MLDAAAVRALVGQLPGAVEGAHHGHPDFRVGTRIFATLSEREDRAALRLTAAEARALAAAQPAAVRLVSDREPVAWVRIDLAGCAPEAFGDLLAEAWRLVATAQPPKAQRATLTGPVVSS